MDEIKKPFVILDLDKPRQFRLTLNAIIELQELTGLNLEKPEQFAQAAVNEIKILRTILWVGLKKANPDLTEDEVGDLIDINNIGDVSLKVFAHMGIKPQPDPGKKAPRARTAKKRPAKPSPGPGKAPSQQPAASA